MAGEEWIAIVDPPRVPGSPRAVWFRRGPLAVCIGREGDRWHLSISHPSRYPTWDEIADARYHFLGDYDMALILPPKADYVNWSPFVFHLWEIRDPALPIERGTAMIRTIETGARRP